jgi:hypothetical protein
MLEIVIGIIFVLLLLSLLATTVMELIAGMLTLRGQNLQRALKHILGQSGNLILFERFQENALFKQLTTRWLGKHYPPSYMHSSSFWSVLFGILREGKAIETIDDLRTRLKNLPDDVLKEALLQLLDEVEYKYNGAEQQFDAFRQKVEDWYDNVMDRASGWYKRSTQAILLIIGIIIAVSFDADVIELYSELSANPEVAAQVADQAEDFILTNQMLLEQADSTQQFDAERMLNELNTLVEQNVKPLQGPLGLGWDQDELANRKFNFWLLKVAGWIVTALSITLGAPFWFDLLKMLVNIRSSGGVPQQTIVVKNEK